MNYANRQYLDQGIISHDVASSFRNGLLAKIVLAQYSVFVL